MTKVRYTLSANGKRLTVTALSEVADQAFRQQAEQRLAKWSQSLRTQALRHLIEQRAGEDVARQARVCYTPGEDKT